ncbi:hypothetical protein U14_03286 [Candidatus Moduliflexus flocculans]|uniref:Uncharacterized protein n=1 Tax=Candidatus Moduliflexus flocculans TaxID=1499966 RepID=A0A081BNS3_9BACT|nr:hypothetical protein U14_03286 [Candidatus Moduliflexus flocculans]
MDERKFEEMMEKWASHEMASAPKLQPTGEMLAAVKAKKQPFFFPMFARWATVGVAVAAMLIATLIYPRWYQPKQAMQKSVTPVSSVSQPVAAAPKTQNTGEDVRAVTEGEQITNEEAIADKGLTPPDIAPPAPEPKITPMAAERREMSGNREEAAEKEGDAPLLMGRGKDETVAQSAQQKADSSTPALEVFIAPEKEKAAKPKICAVQPVGSNAPQESDSMLAGKIVEDTSTSSFEQQASKLMSKAQPEIVAQCQQIGDKTFMLEHEVWVDSEHAPDKTTLAIQRDSEAYRQALELRPELKPYFDALPRVIVNLGEFSLEVSPQGKMTLSEEDIIRLKK